MNKPGRRALVAVDIGNSRIKLGLFAAQQSVGLPLPVRTLEASATAEDWERIGAWLDPFSVAEADWWIGSVHRSVSGMLIRWLRERGATHTTLVVSSDLPLVVRLPRSDMVGIDRLIDAVAANQLRDQDQPAVVVDMGTAITVDLVSAAGEFLGGAIVPGLGTSARALHQFTDLLPLIDVKRFATQPEVLGRGTEEAVSSGLFWSAVGGIRELVSRLASDSQRSPCVLVTGGGAELIAPLLNCGAEYVPHLTLSGIALAALK